MLDATSQAIDTYLDEEDKAMSDLAEMADQQRKMDREEGAPDNAVDPVPQVEEAKPILIDAIYPALCAPFPTKSISWRVGRKSKDGKKAQVLAYIDARDVMGRLDRTVGWENWEDTYREVGAGRIVCSLSIIVNGVRVTKEDGAGVSDIEGEKGALSDALKRAAVKFGVGRYLYYLDAPWVELGDYGKFNPPSLPRWAVPVDER
jgi:hypothetical protein